MSFRAVVAAVLPPRPGGASVSLGQILGGLARAGAELCVVAPITAEQLRDEGDWYAAQNPRLRVLRYLVPGYYAEANKPMPPDIAAAEEMHVPRLVRALVSSFRPQLLVAGVESIGPLVRPLAAECRLPWCQLLRGSPTAQILSGRHPDDLAHAFVDHLRSADRIIAVARYMADGLARRFDIEGVRTIPNAVDLATFAPRPAAPETDATLGLPPGAAMVLCPGRLLPRKRPLDVLQAAVRVTRLRPDAVFVLPGVGVLADPLARFVREHGLERHVRLPGWIAPAAMARLYDRADIVVMASSEEGMSRVYLEAMASGRPLIASDIAPARELVTDGGDGLLYPMGDSDALAERILRLLGDGALRAALGRAARERVADRDPDRAVAAYLKELGALAARGP